MSIQNIEDSCRAACEAIGVIYKPVPNDGGFHVADLENDHKGKNDGRIKIFQDRQGGIVFNNKSGAQQAFFTNNKSNKSLSPADRERIQREQKRRNDEQKASQDKAARKAKATWKAGKPAPKDYSYLVRKQVGPHGLRVGRWERAIQDDNGKRKKLIIDDALLMPMFDADGDLRSLQAIFKETHPELGRDKDFLPGGAVSGLFWWLGPEGDVVFIAEGFATAASLSEETGCRVFVALTAGNLSAVGKIVRAKLPEANIIFCADNDEKTAGNPGVTKANEAAAEIGAYVYTPPISGDYNDWAAYRRGLIA